jgi:siroheme synthase (precorrin-2 oxidase/ferrochelatase)
MSRTTAPIVTFIVPLECGGPLQIAISTPGHSGALAQRLRQELGQQFGPEWSLGRWPDFGG